MGGWDYGGGIGELDRSDDERLGRWEYEGKVKDENKRWANWIDGLKCKC